MVMIINLVTQYKFYFALQLSISISQYSNNFRQMFPLTNSKPVQQKNTGVSRSLGKSHLVSEQYKYVVYDPKTGVTKIENSKPNFEGNKMYRKMHNIESKKQGVLKKQMFRDDEFAICDDDVFNLDSQGGQVILKRLTHLYPRKHRFSFFPDFDYSDRRNENGHIKGKAFKVNDKKAEFFLAEVNLFPPEHYKSFFITQDYDEQGRYIMIINYDGKFNQIVVDDYIPVYQNTLEPVWTRDLQNPWLSILLKAWAKLKKGYHNLPASQPTQFLKAFSDSNWRYYNLSKEPGFLFRFQHSENAKIVLKSKSNNAVIEQGLAPNQLGYQLLSIHLQNKPSQHLDPRFRNSNLRQKMQQSFVAFIRSTIPSEWKGEYSYADNSVRSISYMRQNNVMQLERTFFLNENEFFNLFSSAYVTSKRKHAISDYYIIEVPAGTKKAIHLAFTLKKDGFIDFSIQQPFANKRPLNQESKLKEQNEADNKRKKKNGNSYIDQDAIERYQKCKYMLIRSFSSQHERSTNSSDEEFEQQKQFEDISSFDQFKREFDKDYDPLEYYCVQIEHLKGYNKGEGHFINTDKGNYILRFRPQKSDKKKEYIFSYSSNQSIKVRQIDPSNEQRGEIVKQSLISISDKVAFVTLNERLLNERIAFGNEFENIGYGFISICSKKKNDKIIKLEVIPEEVTKSGYELKNQSGYQMKNASKGRDQPFSIVVEPGQSTAIVMKKIKNFGQYIWPPKGIIIMER